MEKAFRFSTRRERRGWRRENGEEEFGDHEEELNDEEIEKQIRKMKKKKAAGADGIAGEAWIYSKDRKIRTKLKEVLRRVWRGEGFPKERREGVIMPIHKNKVENYRGITLLCTAYKMYTSTLMERLRKEIRRKEQSTRNAGRIQERKRYNG